MEKTNYNVQQQLLQGEAARLRLDLRIDTLLGRIGVPTTTGSVALGVMVARDIDITVTVDQLNTATMAAIAKLGAELLEHPQVQEVLLRDDTGSWNVDPAYPDGIYLRLSCKDKADKAWSFDIWFVDEPDRQPDLEHLISIRPRINDVARAHILAIKQYLADHPQDVRIPSVNVYHAVLDESITEPLNFLEYQKKR